MAAIVLMLAAVLLPRAARAAECGEPAAYAATAEAERANLYSLEHAPFGRPERGWAIYAPAAAFELGVACPPGTPAFAAALASWRQAHGLPASGLMDAAGFDALKTLWQSRRPFLTLRARDICPPPPPETALQLAAPEETAGNPVWLRTGALQAYRTMIAAARDAVPEMSADPELLRIFSGFRAPAYDEARCAEEANCDGTARAQCSAHRTGLALDLMLGVTPGYAVDSADDANRLHLAASPAYLWLLANGARFGFVNYPFEPWHWEWTGEDVAAPFQN